VRLHPRDLAELLGTAPPTDEQAAVIGAPLAPMAVIAGAGSGKTETMAARVVWLVANGLVEPERILGLTFTRKAARELATRIRRRLGQLRARGLVDGPAADGEATVSTYDSYAQRIVAEHGMRLGREPDPRLLTPALTWQLAERVVTGYDGPMQAVDNAVSWVLDAVLSLHAQLAGHLVEIDDVAALHARLVADFDRLPGTSRVRGRFYRQIQDVLDASAKRVALLPMVAELERLERERDAIDFAGLSRLAARIAVECPDVGQLERDRFGVVLLDEYQDTSHSQLVLLRGLFGARADQPAHPVTAVGDPFQSIYAFRGASAGTLSRFGIDFPLAGGEPAGTWSLATSFRNRPAVLEVANTLTASLRAGTDASARVHVEPLSAFDPDGSAGPGAVRVGLYASADDETAAIADQIDALWQADASTRMDGTGRSIAVLMRQRSGMDRLAAALRARELPVEVVGLGGLMYSPPVADVVATLRVLADPGAGAAMMRLLTGARWRIGPRDLAALGAHARMLARRSRPVLDDGSGPAMAAERGDAVTIVDAVDDVDGVHGLSAPARKRIARLAGQLRHLRTRVGIGLPDLVAEVVRSLGLDVEVAAATGDVAATGADLDAFARAVADFTDDAPDARLTTFLAYLDAAEEAENGLDAGPAESSADRIQVLTVHGAKGLEWDAVFVAGIAGDVFPNTRTSPWTTAAAELPYELRGDHAGLPRLDLTDTTDQQQVRDRLTEFRQACLDQTSLEESRLAYVAFTRARQLLVCTGARWESGLTKPRRISPFLQQVRDAVDRLIDRQLPAAVLAWVDDAALADTAPDAPVADSAATWPYDPLGPRRAQVADGARLVEQAQADLAAGHRPPEDVVAAGQDWTDDTDLLLAELARRSRSDDVRVELPGQLSVSQLVELRRDPAALARRIRRPVPLPPNPMARRGTAFHAWLEQRFGQAALLDVTELPGSADDGSVDDELLPVLQAAFLASPWADRSPVEVEAAFELVLDGVAVRGRADAVFAAEHLDEPALEVVDWKTGPPPEGAAARAAAVQLAAYRLAFAHLHQLPLDEVSAAFHYVRAGLTRRPADLLDHDGLLALLRSVDAG